MSIYRRYYKCETAKGVIEKRQQKHYTIEIRHPVTKKILRKPGPQDRKAAKIMEANWITALERGEVGLHDPYRPHRSEPIADAIKAYTTNLETEGKDDQYIQIASERLHRLARECEWKTIYDASIASFEKWRTKTKKKGYLDKPTKPKTLNQFLATAKHFFKWCRRTGRIASNPLAEVDKVREFTNENFRRPATPEEIEKFLPALPSDELRRFYIFLAYTALRRGSLESLKWDDLVLEGDRPRVVVWAENNKTRRKQEFVLRRDVADMMKEARGDAKGKDRVFRVPTIHEHRAYLANVGIPFDDGHGQHRLDIHAFRKTLQTWMEDAGIDFREASKALGHLDERTTLKHYRVKREADPQAGVEKLPTLIRK